VALAEACIGSGLGADLTLPETELSPLAALFSESHARFVIAVPPQHEEETSRLFGSRATRIGTVGGGSLIVRRAGKTLIASGLDSLALAYETRLS
jgi:phosphoribosylformylglycinamidine synthase